MPITHNIYPTLTTATVLEIFNKCEFHGPFLLAPAANSKVRLDYDWKLGKNSNEIIFDAIQAEYMKGFKVSKAIDAFEPLKSRLGVYLILG